jgi:hypothetical protein
MRRPYGLDYVTLAISLTGCEGDEAARHSFGVLRPIDFYPEGTVPSALAQLMEEWQAGIRSIVALSPVVMFSWET